MWQMLQTLRWLHSLHVWHRDIKSQNVFLVWQNGQRVAKVREEIADCQLLLHDQ